MEIIKEEKNRLFDTKLHLSFKNINYIILNTLRRTILQSIPIFIFDIKTLKINYNTSIFNNDYMKLRLSLFPIINFDNKKDNLKYFIDLMFYKEIEINQLTMQCNYHNTTNDNFNVTTDHCNFFIGTTKINNIYDKPLLVIKLKPNEKISFNIKSKLEIAQNNDIASPVSICSYEELKDNHFNFFIESIGQINERDIIKRACDIIKMKLELIYDNIKDKEFKIGEVHNLVLEKENATIGNLVSFYLQLDNRILNAGFYTKHPLDRNIIIKFILKSSTFKEILKKIIDDINKIFDSIKDGL